MAPAIVHLPNGQTLNVTPVFGGLYFKANDLGAHHSVFPPGWTIILNSEDHGDHKPLPGAATSHDADDLKARHIHRFKRPTLRNDHLFMSSISNPASNEFRPPTSPSRQIAMMLWATLYWYFHQQEPEPQLHNATSEPTPDAGKPKAEWKININREGIFTSKHLLPKMERMGLIASEDSTVGLDPEDGMRNQSSGWTNMFVSRRSFWQLDPRVYLFTLAPLQTSSPYPALSPAGSRPASPNRNSQVHEDRASTPLGMQATAQTLGMSHRASTPPGPFHSASHLPTYYPPPPCQYTFTDNMRHPIRPKPPRQGETFYTRYVPSLGQYISFRVASLSERPIVYNGPFSQHDGADPLQSGRDILRASGSFPGPKVPTIGDISIESRDHDTTRMTDVEILHKWMNDPRVSHSWGEQGSIEHQEEFLKHGLTSRHSIPVIGCFNGKPFGYFEIYWVKEDRLAQYLGGEVADWDRGLHVLVGEQEFRGPHRLKVWLNALLHFCWLSDSRTHVVMMEPRVDNVKLRKYCEEAGFYREREVSLPHKQSNLMKIRREAWEAPAL
ncbi:hypothetical protein DOTSEDRAFT_61925 [Dothistroma septosporum NZE10]|uniref:Acyltransferase MbtK/IucB-like conserved domain-containing protein n=1 Tax=Dothistroma septosporum (strain NZE10 / CBS 128990) TaxID=675120 RepID=N1PR25_DOTSN|nr:hypothetical protein DOTSEDRAFT_61925 [Dothistroma septosporum NZE10]